MPLSQSHPRSQNPVLCKKSYNGVSLDDTRQDLQHTEWWSTRPNVMMSVLELTPKISPFPSANWRVCIICASLAAFASSPSRRLRERTNVSNTCRTSAARRKFCSRLFASAKCTIACAVETCDMSETHESRRITSSEAEVVS